METDSNTKSRARSSKSTNRKAQNSQSEGQSSQSNIDESFFDAKRVKNNDVAYLKPPKPESAPNKFIAKLFESP